MNEIKPCQTDSATPAVVQTGERSIYVENKENASVNININLMLPNASGNMVSETRQLNMSRYHLIVTTEDIFDTRYITMITKRSLVKTSISEDAYAKYASLSTDAIAEMIKFPAIICQESKAYYGKTDTEQQAIYGLIRKITKINRNVHIYFHPLCYIPQHKLYENAVDFGIDVSCAISDLNHTAWTIRDVNLLEACQDAGIQILVPST